MVRAEPSPVFFLVVRHGRFGETEIHAWTENAGNESHTQSALDRERKGEKIGLVSTETITTKYTRTQHILSRYTRAYTQTPTICCEGSPLGDIIHLFGTFQSRLAAEARLLVSLCVSALCSGVH